STVNFTDLSTGTSGSTSYLWDFGDGYTSTTQGNVSHVYSVAGVYDVSLTITEGTSSTQTFTNFITVNALPTPPVITASGSTT
ncbi:MAG: PKD domain-containing protein, partial [Bacteroidia bacterium]|nr:PKD domain-containing protein [Bacteroidia bacterium]